MIEIFQKIINFIKNNKAFVFFLCLAFFLWLVILFFNQDAFVDEKTHLRQITRFRKENYEILPSLTTIPGYHAVVAFLVQPFNHSSLTLVRFVSFLLSSSSIGVFYLISKKFNAKYPLIKTLQFAFLPISFLYFPLIYTDIFSLLLVLLTLYFMLSSRYKLSAFFALASILVRQNNIIWIVFIWTYEYLSTYGFSFSLKNIGAHLRRTVGHIMVFVAFAIFFLVNNGVALGDKNNHQIGFYMGNSYFFLATVGLLFLPMLLASIIGLTRLSLSIPLLRRDQRTNLESRLRKADCHIQTRKSYIGKINLLKIKPFIFYGVAIGAVIAGSFMIIQPEIHHGNNKPTLLRNILLQAGNHQYMWAYVMIIFIGYLALFMMKLEKSRMILLPFIFVSLLPSLLVEQRYYIVPLVLLLLFRRESGKRAELTLTLYFIILSLALVFMIFNTGLFF